MNHTSQDALRLRQLARAAVGGPRDSRRGPEACAQRGPLGEGSGGRGGSSGMSSSSHTKAWLIHLAPAEGDGGDVIGHDVTKPEKMVH